MSKRKGIKKGSPEAAANMEAALRVGRYIFPSGALTREIDEARKRERDIELLAMKIGRTDAEQIVKEIKNLERMDKGQR